MQKITTTAELKDHIQQLEHRQKSELLSIKEQLCVISEGLKPINIIKDTFKSITSSPDLGSTMANAAIGLTTGFVAKRILLGKTHNLLTKLAGIILEATVASTVAKNGDSIRSVVGKILKKITDRKEVIKKT